METTIVDYKNGIYAIDQQMVRAFLIVGTQKALLLDTGAIEADLWHLIREITPLPVRVILTHGDVDHIENLHQFTEAWLCKKDKELVQNNPNCKRVMLHTLMDGESIVLGDRTLTVVFTPGHTNGSICLLDKEHRILFSGDTISYGPVFLFGENWNLDIYLQSLQKLQQMSKKGEFTEVYCCHNVCPVSGECITELIDCVEGVLNKSIVLKEVALPIPVKEKMFLAKTGASGILVSNH